MSCSGRGVRTECRRASPWSPPRTLRGRRLAPVAGSPLMPNGGRSLLIACASTKVMTRRRCSRRSCTETRGAASLEYRTRLIYRYGFVPDGGTQHVTTDNVYDWLQLLPNSFADMARMGS